MSTNPCRVVVVEEPSNVAVALLYETPALGMHMRDALASLGTAVVYDEATHALDRDALMRSQASVVVINLDAGNDPDLEDLCDLLGDERYRVVFNDGDVSIALSGWDHARWLRHLAAKIRGCADDVDPPRPPGAEPVATPAPVTGTRAGGAVSKPQSSDTDLSFDPSPASPASHTPGEAYPEDALLAQIPFDSSVEPSLVDRSDVAGAMASTPDDGESDILDRAAAESAQGGDAGDAANDPGADTLVAFQSDDGFGFAVMPAQDALSAEPAISDAPADDRDLDEAGDFSLNFDEVALDVSAAQTAPTVPDWELDDLDEEPPAFPAPDAPADFGIETLRPEEFLAPETDPAATFEEPAASALELIPLEDAVAPVPIESAGRESWLESAPGASRKTRIHRVWVLGASIGGPESVREFLAQMPRDFPALFLVAQHLGDEFVDMMTQQLAKATKLTVRTPSHGDRVSHGEILIVPTSQRLQVGEDGVVVLERDFEERAFSPSIDRVLKGVADRFGERAGAIIFSGMSDDAVEGCRYLAEKGGLVYAQEPDTCVISTMIDGVCETGVVSFLGSPQELAEKLLDHRG